MIEHFFLEIDKRWKRHSNEPILLPIIGSTALFLQCSYNRGTRDSDVLQIGNLSDEIAKSLLKIAGPGTRIAKRNRLYISIISSGIPFLPMPPLFHPLEALNQKLKIFRVEVLDVVDVVVSKLKTFRTQDVEDIRNVINLQLVSPERLVERFKSAVEWWSMDARAGELPRYVENLHTVQRDLFDVAESEIELPDWICK